MICTCDTKGHTVWVAQNKNEFKPHLVGLRERKEPYRIVRRTLSALGGSCEVVVLVIGKLGEKI